MLMDRAFNCTSPSQTSMGGRAVLCLGATALLLILSSGHVVAQSSDGPGIEWVLPQEHRLFLNGVPGDATIDREWPMVTGLPEGDIEFDKTSSILPTALFDIYSEPLEGPVGLSGNITVELFASLSTQSDACRLSNILPGSPLGSTTTFYVSLVMGSYVILDQAPTQTLVMDESFVAPHLFTVSAQDVNVSLGPGDTIGLQVSVQHECAQTGHVYWGTFDAHSGIVIEGDVLNPSISKTVDLNRIVRIEFDPSSPWGQSDYATQTVDIVGPYVEWSEMAHSFYDEDLRVDHFEDPHGSSVGESNASLRTWSLSDPLDPGRYMIDVCIQLSDRPYAEQCEAYAVLRFQVLPDEDPLMNSSIAAVLIPLIMFGGVIAGIRHAVLPSPVYGTLLILVIATAAPAYSLGHIDHNPVRSESHPPSFTLLSHSGGSQSIDSLLEGHDALVVGVFAPGSPNAATQYSDFSLAMNLAEKDVAFVQIATSPDLLAIDVDEHAAYINESWPILLDTASQDAGRSLPSGPSDAVIILDANGFVSHWSPRSMSSTEILDSISDSDNDAISNAFAFAILPFSLIFLPLLVLALPRSSSIRDPVEGEFPGTGALLSVSFASLGFALWFAPLCLLIAIFGQKIWLPVSIGMGLSAMIMGHRILSNGVLGPIDRASRAIFFRLPPSSKSWTSPEEASDDIHMGVWVALLATISEPTLVAQGVLSVANITIIGPLLSIITLAAFSIMGGCIVVACRLIVAMTGRLARIIGPMSTRIRIRTWGSGIIVIGLWWTVRDVLLILSTSM